METKHIEGFDRETAEAADVDLYERTELPLDEIWGCIGDSARDVYQLLGVDEEEDDEDEFYWDEDWMEEQRRVTDRNGVLRNQGLFPFIFSGAKNTCVLMEMEFASPLYFLLGRSSMVRAVAL